MTRLPLSDKQQRVAYFVEIHGYECIVFAETAAKARWIGVRSFWDAFGKNGWPRPTSQRAPRYDRSPLAAGERIPFTLDYVEDSL